MKTDRRGARKINDGAVAERVPSGADDDDDDEAPGQAPLSRRHTIRKRRSGVGAGTLSTDGTPPYLTQFFFHAAEAAKLGNPIL